MKILIAEDEDISRKTLAKGLQKQGFEVVETTDGEQAWQKMQEPDAPKLLVLDIMMPLMDGLELCKKIKSYYTSNPPYIILLTAMTDEEYIVYGLEEAGADDYITKPYNFNDLKARILVGQRMLEMQSSLLAEITNREKTEERLRQLNEEYERVFDGTQDAMFLVSVESLESFRFIRNNEAHQTATGISLEAIRDKTPEQLLGEELGKKVTQNYINCVKAGKPISYEEDLDLAGVKRTWSTTLTPVFENSKIQYIVASSQDISERKQAEERLLESERRTQAITNSALEAIIMMNPQGNISYWNPMAESIFGYSAAEVMGQNLHILLAPKRYHEAYANAFPHFQKTGNGNAVGQTIDLTAACKDGREIPITLSLSSVLLQNEWHAVGIVQDITQRKQFEQALQQKSQALKERVKELDCLYGLSKLIEQPGLTRDELMQSTTELIPPAYQYPERTCVRILLENKTYTTCGFRESKWRQSADIVVDKNQVGRLEVFYIQETTDLNENPFLNEERALLENLAEKLNHYLERQKVEKELQESEQKTKAALKEVQELLNSISTLLISLDHNWQIYRWNNAAEEILGISKEKTQGVYLNQCPVSWDWGKIEAGLRESQVGQNQVTVEDISYLTADNVNGFLSITIHPIMEEDEELLAGFLILGADITGEKLMESQFLQDQKMDAIGQLAAGIAHEINTPIQYVDGNTNYLKDVFQDILGLIDSYSQLLEQAEWKQVYPSLLSEIKQKQENLDIEFMREDIPNSLDESLEGLQKVAKIVRSMKNFAHPGESDKIQVDINKALEDTITICKNEWKYSADVNTDYDPDLPLVPCFKDEINQVFLNIIVNSAQAIAEYGSSDGKEKGSINVSTDKDSEYAVIRFSDTGPGIPEHIRHRIFNPFFTTKEVGKGSGQGLYIAYNITTEKHQGVMDFESELGKGTTFVIKLPLN